MQVFLFILVLLPVHGIIISSNVSHYFYVQDECQHVYFIIYQEENTVKYAVNYTPFSDIDIIIPRPPFFPRILFENETLVHVAIDRVYQRLHILSNTTWYEFDYHLNERARRDSNDLELIAFDHYRNLLTCYVDVCQTTKGQKARLFSKVTRIHAIDNNTWLIETKDNTFLFDSDHVITPVNEWHLKYQYTYTWHDDKICTDKDFCYSPLITSTNSEMNVINKNLFIFTSINESELVVESWHTSRTLAPHDFCNIDQNFTYVLRCTNGTCSSEIITLQEIISGGEYVRFEQPVTLTSLNLTEDGIMYLSATINLTTGDLRGTIITNGKHVIYCDNCTITATVNDEKGMLKCISQQPQVINFIPCDPELVIDQEKSNIYLYILIGCVIAVVLISAGVVILFLKQPQLRKVFFPFRDGKPGG